MLGVPLVGDDPRDIRQVARPGVSEEVRDVLDVSKLAVLVDVGERRERIPDIRGADGERRGRAVRNAALAVGLATRGDEVAPADAVRVQQVGDVGPRIVVGGRGLAREPGAPLGELVVHTPPALRDRVAVARARGGWTADLRRCGHAHEAASLEPASRRVQQLAHPLGRLPTPRSDADDVRGLVAPELVVVDTARGGSRHGALRRPLGHLVQVSRQAPRRIRLKHVVIEHEVLGVCPVVRDLARIVVTHHVGRRQRAAHAREASAPAAALESRIAGRTRPSRRRRCPLARNPPRAGRRR